jgi:aryl-alcohol dehydrogenase-like predicted oxidoreductase
MLPTPRPLGRSGLQALPLAFGGNVFGWTADETTSFALLDAFTEVGCTLVDTADRYSGWVPGHQGGESETLIGRWIALGGGRRDRILLATKLGKSMGPGLEGLSPAYMQRALEASLRRLRTDVIDLYQAHADDPQTPLEDSLHAFAGLIQAGKLRAIGASNFSAERFRAALAVSQREGLPRYETLQPEYNLCTRKEFERDLAPLALEQGIGTLCYYGLAAGFLSGKYHSAADFAGHPRAAMLIRYASAQGWATVEALRDIAARHSSRPSAVAIAWLRDRPGVTAPIVSATSLDQLQTLLDALRLELSAEDLQQLETVSAPD